MTRAEALVDVLTVLQDGTHWTPAGSLRLFSMADALVALVLRSDDRCPCGREASAAVGDPLQDHEPTCAVYLAAKVDAAQEFGTQQGDRAEQATRHLTVARETIARLNRRCQTAEKGLAAKVRFGPGPGSPILRDAAVTMLRSQLADAECECNGLRDHVAEIQQQVADLLGRLHVAGEAVDVSAPELPR